VYATIGEEYVEPGVSTSEGTLIIDHSELYMSRVGESYVFYSAIDDADNVGHATRKVIVKNPSEILEGTYNVEVVNTTSGVVEDVYTDVITQDLFTNGKFAMNNFATPCSFDKIIYGKYDWSAQTVDVYSGQDNDGQAIENLTGNTFAITFNGIDISFEMELTVAGATSKYVYRKRNDPVPSSYVRVLNTSPDVGAIDFRVDNVVSAPGIAQLANSNYLTTAAGTRSIKFNTSSSCTNLLNTVTTNNENVSYTFVLVDYLSTLDYLKLEDDLSAPPADQARIRFLHAAPGIANVDVLDSITNATLTTNVAFKNNSTFSVTIPQGQTTMDIGFKMVDAGTTNQVAGSTIPVINVAAGKVYTLYSYIDQSFQPAFKLILDK